MKYPCDKCKYLATTANSLKLHIKSKHEGVNFPCEKCEYVATQASNLKQHIETKHEGVRYPCDKCEYAATTANSLKYNIKAGRMWKNVYYELFSYQTENVHEIGKVFFDNVLQGFWISRFWI